MIAKIRTIRNPHHSAHVAAAAWLSGSLWGQAIDMGAHGVHVYGAWRRNWTAVWVDFRREHIIVVLPQPVGFLAASEASK